MSYLRFALLALVVVFVSVGPNATLPSARGQETESAAAEPAEADHEHEDGEHDNGEHSEGDDAHGEAHALPPILSFDPGAAVVNLAIFLGTFFILAQFVWPVILGGLQAREEKIASDLEGAQAANVEAQAKLAAYEKKVQEAAAEAQSVLAEARKDAQVNATKIIDDAKADAARQGERALADIETAKKVALAEIANQTSSLAMGVAKQVVGRELKADDHADLIKKALEQVPSNN